MMERVWWGLLLAGMIAVVDLWSVYSSSGITHKAAEAESGIFSLIYEYMAVMVPVVGYDDIAGFIGLVDIAFTMMFSVSTLLFGLPARRTAIAIFAGFMITTAVGSYLEALVPALPALSLAFCLINGPILIQSLVETMQSSGEEELSSELTDFEE
jgi:hypothetical protein